MQTYVVPKPSQQAPENAHLPSQQIQVPPPTSASRLAPNSHAQDPGYLAAYQLGSPLGTSAAPRRCWARDPDAKPYDDVAEADKLDMNRNRRIQGQKRFVPQRSELDIKTWDVWNYFHEFKGSVVELVEFDNEDRRWCILDDDRTHGLKVVGFPTETFYHPNQSAPAASPSRSTAATTFRNAATQTHAEGKSPSSPSSQNRGSRTLETPSDLQMISNNQDDRSPDRPVKRSLMSESYRAGTPFAMATDLVPARRQQRPASRARDAGKLA
ncbi:MAG: hypothetical protein Q9180_009025, partial [Flavoplaca navasiana]